MRKIVDSNYLRDQKLRDYLSKSQSNYVVLTDYAAMEAYKGDTLRTIYESMAILSEFPDQVIVLKGTEKIRNLNGRTAGLTRRMIDPAGNKGFKKFCNYLKESKAGNLNINSQLLERGRWANEHMASILESAKLLPMDFVEISKMYSEEELRIFRARNGKYTKAMIEKIIDFIDELAIDVIQQSASDNRLRSAKEFGNKFIFRTCVCSKIYYLRWVRTGQQKTKKATKIHNDLVDLNFATYATYFDGILTNDRELHEIYHELEYLLRLYVQSQGTNRKSI